MPNLIETRRQMIDPHLPNLSIRRQCELLGLHRSTYYYEPVPESSENLELMRLIDEQYMKTPFYGYPRMTVFLQNAGYPVNQKRVARLMRLMDLQALGPKPRTTIANPDHKVYPYLLRDLIVERPNQVWSTDITYVPMQRGFMYLAAVIDWYSRYVLAWQLSNTMDGRFCLDVLEQALAQGTPEIFNTDQGSQFTALAFSARLEKSGIRVSMDGKGRALDNIFIERLWRSVKYEHIYLHGYATVLDLELGLQRYFTFYNQERPHQSLKYLPPVKVHFEPEALLC